MSLFDRLVISLVAAAAAPLFTPDRRRPRLRPSAQPGNGEVPPAIVAESTEIPPDEHLRTGETLADKSSHKSRKSRRKRH